MKNYSLHLNKVVVKGLCESLLMKMCWRIVVMKFYIKIVAMKLRWSCCESLLMKLLREFVDEVVMKLWWSCDEVVMKLLREFVDEVVMKLLRWSCDEVVMKLWWSCDEVIAMKFVDESFVRVCCDENVELTRPHIWMLWIICRSFVLRNFLRWDVVEIL